MSRDAVEFDQRVRWQVYDVTVRTGACPSIATLSERLRVGENAVAASLRRLADTHMLVLQSDSGEILMAGPFSAVPTGFLVTLPAFTCYGNCIWDALGIAAMLSSDARVDTSCADCGSAATLTVHAGTVRDSGFMHFALPPRLWWENIVFT